MITIVVFKCMNGKWIYHSRSCKENRVFQSIHFLVHTNRSVTHVWKHYNRLSYVSVFNKFTRYQTMFHTFRCIFFCLVLSICYHNIPEVKQGNSINGYLQSPTQKSLIPCRFVWLLVIEFRKFSLTARQSVR